MTKKLVGLLTAGLFCVGIASATNYVSDCGTISANGSGQPSPGTPTSVTCGTGFTIPSNDTLTSITVVMDAGYSNGTNSPIIEWTFTVGTLSNGFALAPGSQVETVSGGFQPTTFTFGPASVGSCTNPPDTLVPDSTAEDCASSVSINGALTSTASFVVSASDVWSQGNTVNTGATEADIFAVYTYSSTVSTPEPASLLMIGGGLVSLGVFARRRRKA